MATDFKSSHMKLIAPLLGLIWLSFACSTTPEETTATPPKEAAKTLETGIWQLQFDLGKETLPINFEVSEAAGKTQLHIINDSERILVDDIKINGDSVRIRMPFFDSEFVGVLASNEMLTGNWYNYSKKAGYHLPFTAKKGLAHRFDQPKPSTSIVKAGNWETTFSPDTENDWYKAIGQFKQEGSNVAGTFITETGDYRFLDGVIDGDSMFLSCFDGSHAFLFKAHIQDENTLSGTFWSGNHWTEPWVATYNEAFELRDPNTLTFLKPGYEKLEFSFPDLDSNMVALTDEKYKEKVVMVQIMGSWCPNCLDESTLYKEIYDTYNAQGLEIVALAYEASPEFAKAKKSVIRLKERLNAKYDFLIGGVANKKKTAETLPMLNHVMSYPTTIFLDRKGNIRKIHTGFYGPGTGKLYDDYVTELHAFLNELLAESVI